MRKINYGLLALLLFTTAPLVTLASTYGTDFLVSCPTPTADSNYGASYTPDKAFDNNNATRWYTETGSPPHWLQCDLGTSTAKLINKIDVTHSQREKSFYVQGSTDNSTWVTVYASDIPDDSGTKTTTSFYSTSTVPYRYVKLVYTSRYDAGTAYDAYDFMAYECLDCSNGSSTISTSTMPNTEQFFGFATIYLLLGFVALGYWIAFKIIRRKK